MTCFLLDAIYAPLTIKQGALLIGTVFIGYLCVLTFFQMDENDEQLNWNPFSNYNFNSSSGSGIGKSINTSLTATSNTNRSPVSNSSDNDINGTSPAVSDDNLDEFPPKMVHGISTSLADLMLADKLSVDLGYTIIDTFVELYGKYIASSSEFEINIQSNTRHTLECMLDSHFFAMWSINSQHKPEIALKKQPSVTAHEVSLWDRLRYESMVHWKVNRANSSMNVVKQIESSHKTLIKAEFEKFREITADITERELLEWLIKQLIEPTEMAVREIAHLMNDSFSRFRKNSKVYAKVVHLAREFHNN